jgi:hypothetical protein
MRHNPSESNIARPGMLASHRKYARLSANPSVLHCGLGRAPNLARTQLTKLPAQAVGKGKRLAHSGAAVSRRPQSNTVADLARFFPEATPVRIPVELTPSGSQPENTAANPVCEKTTIEYGTAREVLFACCTRLEFADKLRLRNSDGSLDTEVSVVAVQYHPERTIVAARFLKPVPNWIVKS